MPPTRDEQQQRLIADLVRSVVKEFMQSKEHRAERKEMFKEAMRELLVEQQAAFGRWSFWFIVGGIGAVVCYMLAKIKGII